MLTGLRILAEEIGEMMLLRLVVEGQHLLGVCHTGLEVTLPEVPPAHRRVTNDQQIRVPAGLP